MDPQITWQELQQAYSAREWDKVEDLAEALLDWLNMGGTAPDTSAVLPEAEDWHRFVCLAVAESGLSQARARRR
jgi:hypothetical protein